MLQGSLNLLSNMVRPLEKGVRSQNTVTAALLFKGPLAFKVNEIAKKLFVNVTDRTDLSQPACDSKSYFKSQLPIAEKELGLPRFVMPVYTIQQTRAYSKVASNEAHVDLGIMCTHKQIVAASVQIELFATICSHSDKFVSILDELNISIEALRWELDLKKRNDLKGVVFIALNRLFNDLRSDFLVMRKAHASKDQTIEVTAQFKELVKAKDSALDALALL